MSEKSLKIIVILFIAFVAWQLLSSGDDNSQYNVNVKSVVTADEGLDLSAVGSLLKEAKDAEALEKLLNSKEKGINNLDLDEDGSVDYIKVSEFGTDTERGYSLTVELAKDDIQEVATIEVKKSAESGADVAVKGNEHVYGRNHHYHSHFGLTDYLFLRWAFMPRPFYYSPWGYGRYPGYYGGGYRTVSRTQYRSNTKGRTTGSQFKKGTQARGSSITSPNAKRNASRVKAPMKNPSKSQRSFQAKNPSKQKISKGGFGKKSKSSFFGRSSNRSIRSGGFGRSGRSFGGK